MTHIESKKNIPEKTALGIIEKPINRRNFLAFTGISAVALTIGLQSCSDDPVTPSGFIDVGTGDIGVLNYAYALEQLEAAFYVRAASAFYNGATSEEIQILTDIREHEIAHREFFKAALGTSAIRALEVNFDSIDFTSRASVLGTAKTFEDLGVSAYNGVAYIIQNVDYLALAGKIVSVEARHAAAISDLLSPRTIAFANDTVINAAGLELTNTPQAVVNAANGFLKTKISANNLA
ncbi:MAG: ferritin-like domain-containing protein [Ignavibacteria bacterium]